MAIFILVTPPGFSWESEDDLIIVEGAESGSSQEKRIVGAYLHNQLADSLRTKPSG